MICFWELSTCRTLGQGVIGPIPWTAVDRWCQRHSVDDEVFDYLAQLIRGIDEVYLEEASRKLRNA